LFVTTEDLYIFYKFSIYKLDHNGDRPLKRIAEARARRMAAGGVEEDEYRTCGRQLTEEQEGETECAECRHVGKDREK